MLVPAIARIDDLVRPNRHRFSIGEATSDEIAALPILPFDQGAGPFLDDWIMIAIRDGASCAVHALGRIRKRVCLTAEITASHTRASLVQTSSGGVYTLCHILRGEPPQDYVEAVAHALRVWRYESEFKLGVPFIFA